MVKSDFQFLNPFLKELNFKERSIDTDELVLELENNFQTKIEKDMEEKKALVELKLEINMDNENTPFALSIVMASLFKWEMDMKDDEIDSFLEINAPAFLLSYIRPIVANVTGSSRYPAYNLPFINFLDKNENDEIEP